MPRVALILVAISVVSSCGKSSADTEASSLRPDTSAADPTIASTPVVPDQATTTGIPNSVASTALVPGADVVVDDPLVPGAWTGARTSRDGLSLSLFFVGAADYEPGQPCTMRYVPVVDETDAQVAVAIRGEHPPATANDAMMCAAMGYERSVTVDLAQPFGTRTLVALGQARGVFDGSTLAEPQWMPDGWQADDESPGLVDPAGTTWRRSWRPAGDTSCPLGTSGLALVEGAPEVVSRSAPAVEQTVTGSHDINGTPATETVQANRNITWLTWTVGDRSYVLSSAPACDGDQPPTLDIMLQFARSLDTTAEPVQATTIGPSELPVVDPNSSVPIGQPYQIEVGTHCGVGVLGLPVNGIVWTTDTAQGERNWMPTEWANSLGPGEELITLEVVLTDDATLTATAVGRSVVYRPVGADDPESFCA